MSKTACYSEFTICSRGEIYDGVGLVADDGGGFDPEYITRKLGMEPCCSRRINDPRCIGCGVYTFSQWSGCRQEEPRTDAEEQCLKIVRQLRPLIPRLKEIKEEYSVDFVISIVPHIYNEEAPILSLNSEIIDFCYHTGTEIVVDLYVYDKD